MGGGEDNCCFFFCYSKKCPCFDAFLGRMRGLLFLLPLIREIVKFWVQGESDDEEEIKTARFCKTKICGVRVRLLLKEEEESKN